jgi:hypothetical protein
MAVCLVMQFTGVDAPKYEAVMKELGLQSANALAEGHHQSHRRIR